MLILYKPQKTFEKGIDKRREKWYNMRVAAWGGTAIEFEKPKKTWKKFQKGIDKRKRKWYNIKAVAQASQNRGFEKNWKNLKKFWKRYWQTEDSVI